MDIDVSYYIVLFDELLFHIPCDPVAFLDCDIRIY